MEWFSADICPVESPPMDMNQEGDQDFNLDQAKSAPLRKHSQCPAHTIYSAQASLGP